jgi:hypothetical protein
MRSKSVRQDARRFTKAFGHGSIPARRMILCGDSLSQVHSCSEMYWSMAHNRASATGGGTFYVFNLTGGATISDAQGVGTILDDDAPVAPSIHVADLDATSTPGSRGKWDATVTVTVVNPLGQVMAGVTVVGYWSDDSSAPVTITTDANGVATFTRTNINKKESSLTFTVDNLSVAGYQYDPLANEDENGDSNGTEIKVLQP